MMKIAQPQGKVVSCFTNWNTLTLTLLLHRTECLFCISESEMRTEIAKGTKAAVIRGAGLSLPPKTPI